MPKTECIPNSRSIEEVSRLRNASTTEAPQLAQICTGARYRAHRRPGLRRLRELGGVQARILRAK